MAVKRKLKLDAKYIIQDALPSLKRGELVGYKCRVMLQLADDPLPRHFLSVEAILLQGPQAGVRLLLQGVRLRRYQDERPTCRCKAYSFPHHRGTGRCYAKGFSPFCGECGRSCDVAERTAEPEERKPSAIYKNEGLIQKSNCCKAALYDDAELTIPYSED